MLLGYVSPSIEVGDILLYFSPLICYATVPRGFSSLPMLSRCTHLGIARAAPPCTSGSANDRRRTRNNRDTSPRHRDIEKNFNACIEISSRCFEATYYRRYIAEQRRTVGEHSAMYTKVKISQAHRRHIGDTSAMLV